MTTHPSPDTPISPDTPYRPDTPTRPDSSAEGQGPRPGSDAGADEIVADIEATRAELGETVDALSEKFDVKAQTKQGLDEARARAGVQARAAQQRGTEALAQAKDAATDDQGNLTPAARGAAFAAAALAAGSAVVVARRRRR